MGKFFAGQAPFLLFFLFRNINQYLKFKVKLKTLHLVPNPLIETLIEFIVMLNLVPNPKLAF